MNPHPATVYRFRMSRLSKSLLYFLLALCPVVSFGQPNADAAEMLRLKNAGVKTVIQRYAAPYGWWTDDTAVSVFNKKHYDKSGRVVLEELVQNGRVYIRYFYTYDLKGNLIRAKYENYDSPGFNLVTDYTYDTSGKCLSTISKDTSGKVTIRERYWYDKSGFLTSKTRDHGDTSAIHLQIFTYKYSQGKLHKETYGYANEVLPNYKLYHYDRWGNVTHTEHHSKNTVTFSKKDTWDKHGRIIRSTNPDAVKFEISYTYGANGLLSQTEINHQDELRFTRYEYNEKNLLLRKTDDPIQYNNGVARARTLFTYDSLGRLVSKVSSRGSHIYFEQHLKYHRNGKIAEETEKSFSTEITKKYTYDDRDSLIRVVSISLNFYEHGGQKKVLADSVTHDYTYQNSAKTGFQTLDSETIKRLVFGIKPETDLSEFGESGWNWKQKLRPSHNRGLWFNVVAVDTFKKEIYRDSIVHLIRMNEHTVGCKREFLRRFVTGSGFRYRVTDYDSLGVFLMHAELLSDNWFGYMINSREFATDSGTMTIRHSLVYLGRIEDYTVIRNDYRKRVVIAPSHAVFEYFYRDGKPVKEYYFHSQGYGRLTKYVYDENGNASLLEVYGSGGDLTEKIHRVYKDKRLVEEWTDFYRSIAATEYLYEYYK